MESLTTDDLPRAYKFHVILMVVVMLLGLYPLTSSATQVQDSHWSFKLAILAYLISFILHCLYWKMFPSWRESSKFDVPRFGGGRVLYLPVLGPILAFIGLPLLFMAGICGLLSQAEMSSRFSHTEDITFTSIEFSPEKSNRYEGVRISDGYNLRFGWSVEIGSQIEKEKVIHGKVIFGFLGSEYLLRLPNELSKAMKMKDDE